MAISNKKTVTTAGVRVALATDQLIAGPLMVKALAGNTGKIYVGDVAVSAAAGLELSAGEVVIFQFAGNLSTLYIDSSVNGEGVTWCALNV